MNPVAVYRRTVRASRDRVWENVLDWEHLPWLHAASFTAVELLERGAAGWRAWVGLPPREMGRRALVAVELDRPRLHYWTRTVDGAGAGTEIRTVLSPAAEDRTDIAVEFFVPGVAGERAREVGDAYVRLYTRLWDEDEAMMVRRQEQLDRRRAGGEAPPAELVLGSVEDVRGRLPFTVEIGARRVRLVAVDGAIAAYDTTCPHLGGPLAECQADGVVRCPWHGYRFDVRTGASADGRRLRLAAVTVEIDGGAVRLRSGEGAGAAEPTTSV